METGPQSSGAFTCSHCLPHRENLTRLIESGDEIIASGDEISLPVNPFLTKRSKIITKLPPIVKTSETTTVACGNSSGDPQVTSSMETVPSNLKMSNSHFPSSTNSSTSSSPSLLMTNKTFDDIDNWKSYDSNCDTLDSANNLTLKLRLVEKNLQFIKDQHKIVLNCLHNQIAELSQQNRDLQFKLIVNNLYPDNLEESSAKLDSLISKQSGKDAIPLEVINHITNLEIEVKRLRLALGESLKMNANLRNRLMSKSTKSYQNRQSRETESPNCPVFKSTTKVESFRETWRAINSAKVESTNSFLPGIK